MLTGARRWFLFCTTPQRICILQLYLLSIQTFRSDRCLGTCILRSGSSEQLSVCISTCYMFYPPHPYCAHCTNNTCSGHRLVWLSVKGDTWVISKVLHTVCFLFKNEFILKRHLEAFNVISIVLYHSGPTLGKSFIPLWTPSLLLRLITQVTSLDTSVFLKRFPRSGFFNFGNKSKCGGLSPPHFDLFRRNHYVGNASEALRRCLMR
jgi:hypothetical protein